MDESRNANVTDVKTNLFVQSMYYHDDDDHINNNNTAKPLLDDEIDEGLSVVDDDDNDLDGINIDDELNDEGKITSTNESSSKLSSAFTPVAQSKPNNIIPGKVYWLLKSSAKFFIINFRFISRCAQQLGMTK